MSYNGVTGVKIAWWIEFCSDFQNVADMQTCACTQVSLLCKGIWVYSYVQERSISL